MNNRMGFLCLGVYRGLRKITKNKMGSDFYNSFDHTFGHDSYYPSFLYVINFHTMLLKYGSRNSVTELPRHLSLLVHDVPCAVSNEYDILISFWL